jgi:hypothetical protein
MRKCAEQKLTMLGDSELAAKIIQDIDVLQTSPSEALFDKAVHLFLDKWAKEKNAHMAAYLAYFQKEWIVSHKGWFEGYNFGPSTNNGVEATNAVIKKENTFRKRLNLASFFKVIWLLVNSWSKERHPNSGAFFRKPFVLETTLGKLEYTAAYQWLKNPERLTISNGDTYFSRASSASNKSLTNADVKNYTTSVNLLSFKSFDDYVDIVHGIWKTCIDREDFRKSTCT